MITLALGAQSPNWKSRQPFNVEPKPAAARRRTQKQARTKQNRSTRGNLCREFDGPNHWNNAGRVMEWHRTIENLAAKPRKQKG